MLITTLKLILRNWWRNKTFTLIALLSLTVGIACTNLLGAFVTYEQGIEKSNPNQKRMVWVMQDLPSAPGKKVAYMVKGIPEQVKETYPEVEDFLQLGSSTYYNIEVNGRKFDPIEVLNVNRSFPDFFPFELLYGSWGTFNNPQSIIISQKQAQRFFGEENALGKQITLVEDIFDGMIEKQYTVGAVAKERSQSAIVFDALICDPENAWGGPTLLMMTGEPDLQRFEEKVKRDEIPTLAGGQYYFISLDDAISSNYSEQELTYWHYRKDNLLLVGLISAILVLLIAVFNYVNMGFSRVLQQVKSIHTQKLMGATPVDIRLQLVADTFLMVFISFLLSLLLMYDLLPIFNQIVSADFTSSFFYSPAFFPFFVVFIVLLTVIPAWVISHRINRLSGTDFHLLFVNKKNHWIGGLVTAQFVIGVALIMGMITANRQMDMVKQAGDRYRNLIEIRNVSTETDLRLFKQKVEFVPGVSDISLGNLPLMHAWIMHSDIHKENGEKFQTTIFGLSGDDGLFRILQLHQIAGSDWETLTERYGPAVFVNSTFANLVEKPVESLVGEPLKRYFDSLDSVSVIAGVVEDFYFNSLEEKAMAVVMTHVSTPEDKFTTMQIRLDGNDNGEVIKTIRQLWEQTYPDEYFTYTDVYYTFIQRNNKITEMSHLLQMYSLISILLTCFGLFGISFYAVRRRTKEIGIRKINGAKTYQILWLLLKPVFVWVVIGFAIGVPLAWGLMERWLQQFAYRVDISLVSCLAALAMVTLVSAATVIWHTWRMARTNPVKSLRSE